MQNVSFSFWSKTKQKSLTFVSVVFLRVKKVKKKLAVVSPSIRGIYVFVGVGGDAKCFIRMLAQNETKTTNIFFSCFFASQKGQKKNWP